MLQLGRRGPFVQRHDERDELLSGGPRGPALGQQLDRAEPQFAEVEVMGPADGPERGPAGHGAGRGVEVLHRFDPIVRRHVRLRLAQPQRMRPVVGFHVRLGQHVPLGVEQFQFDDPGDGLVDAVVLLLRADRPAVARIAAQAGDDFRDRRRGRRLALGDVHGGRRIEHPGVVLHDARPLPGRGRNHDLLGVARGILARHGPEHLKVVVHLVADVRLARDAVLLEGKPIGREELDPQVGIGALDADRPGALRHVAAGVVADHAVPDVPVPGVPPRLLVPTSSRKTK